MSKDKEAAAGAMALLVLAVMAAALIGVGMWGIPTYNVWRQEMAGEGELRRAEQSKKILIEQARAELEAAQLRADAIAVVGEIAQKYPEYRKQEFMGAFAEALKEGNVDQIIYVPTEANIPVTEAGRLWSAD